MKQSQLCYQDSDVNNCFEELISSGKLSMQRISIVIDKYQPIIQEQLKMLVLVNCGQLVKAGCNKESSQLQQQYYEQKFIPSPDLLLNYQQIYIKSLHNQQTSVNNNNHLSQIHNNKLNRLYRERSTGNSNRKIPYCSQTNAVNQPITLPYRALSSTYDYFPARAENQRVLIQQKQQTILQQLKRNTHQIQTTIPIIQNSLFQNQLKRLQQKQIQLQNMVGVKGWKLKRQEMINKLATNKNNP